MKVSMKVSVKTAKEMYDFWAEKDKEYYANNVMLAWLGKEGVLKIGAPDWVCRKGFNTISTGRNGCWIRSSGSWISVDIQTGDIIACGARHSLKEIMPSEEEVISWKYIQTSEPGWTPWETADDKLYPLLQEYGGSEKIKNKNESWHAANGTPAIIRRYAAITRN